jgi:hypothetical protein
LSKLVANVMMLLGTVISLDVRLIPLEHLQAQYYQSSYLEPH